jgi:hypothetical protein
MTARERRTLVRDTHDRRAAGSEDARASVTDALTRCRDELTDRVAATRDGPERDVIDFLRGPVADFTRTAASEDIPPERALVMFKRMIGEIADFRGLPPDQRDGLQRQLIELAIESYYEGPASASRLTPSDTANLPSPPPPV